METENPLGSKGHSSKYISDSVPTLFLDFVTINKIQYKLCMHMCVWVCVCVVLCIYLCACIYLSVCGYMLREVSNTPICLVDKTKGRKALNKDSISHVCSFFTAN